MSELDRRRHPRLPARIAVTLSCASARHDVAAPQVLDASLGGLFVELPLGAALPALGEHVDVVLQRDALVLAQSAQVVRLRHGGRARGALTAPAVALLFDAEHSDGAAEQQLEAMLKPA